MCHLINLSLVLDSEDQLNFVASLDITVNMASKCKYLGREICSYLKVLSCIVLDCDWLVETEATRKFSLMS